MGIKGECLKKSELFWFIALMGHSQQYRNHYAESIMRIQHTLMCTYINAITLHDSSMEYAPITP